MKTIIDLQKQYVMPTYAPELVLTQGDGCYVWDDEGNKYLDFCAGISVCNLGHCHPAVTEAICDQARKLVHVSNLYINENQPKLAEKLVNKGFDGVAFFANSGAEANEGMIKFARKWGHDAGKYEIIVMNNSFHGRTLATLAATGQSKYRDGFAPDMPGFIHVDFNDFEAIKQAANDKTVAIMLEPVQGEGGLVPADPDYLKNVRQFCDEKNILLLFDEVQCGMGRTGTFFAYQGFGVEPDAVSLAKALGNGYPIGSFIVKRTHAETLTAGKHASTFGGTPLACAAACAVIDAMDQENILENCNKIGAYMAEKLNSLKDKHSCIIDIRGKGLMIGIAVEPDEIAKKVVAILKEKKMLALTAGHNVIRFLPPLTISQQVADDALKLISEAFSELEQA